MYEINKSLSVTLAFISMGGAAFARAVSLENTQQEQAAACYDLNPYLSAQRRCFERLDAENLPSQEDKFIAFTLAAVGVAAISMSFAKRHEGRQRRSETSSL